jgi:hypothetical protein
MLLWDCLASRRTSLPGLLSGLLYVVLHILPLILVLIGDRSL